MKGLDVTENDYVSIGPFDKELWKTTPINSLVVVEVTDEYIVMQNVNIDYKYKLTLI